MHKISYYIHTEINHGTEERPIIETMLSPVEIICPDDKLERNLELAKAEAYQGEVSVEDAGADPEPEPTLDERVSSLETTKADQTDVNELNEALDMILTGYAGEEATDAEGTAR